MKKILYVLHLGTAGGTFLTTNDLISKVENHYEIFLLFGKKDKFELFRFSNGEMSLLESYPRKFEWSAKDFHHSWLTFIYFHILTKFEIDLVHIRHLIGHSFDLPQVANKLKIPIVLSAHDFYFICPFYVLLNENLVYCEGKCNDNLKNCYNSLSLLNDINSKELISIWRENVSKMFKYVDCFVSTSEIVKDLFLSIYPDMDANSFKVIEHGRDFPKSTDVYHEMPSKDKPIKILFPANHLNKMKGSEIIKNLKKEDKNELLEFHFLGNTHEGIEEFGNDHGPYERDDFCKEVYKIKPSFIGIFSIWPETFCHTLTEAWGCGVPVLGSKIGVIEDRIQKHGGGWVLEFNDSKNLYQNILDIAYDENSYLEVQKKISKIHFKSIAEMAYEYIDIYNGLLKE